MVDPSHLPIAREITDGPNINDAAILARYCTGAPTSELDELEAAVAHDAICMLKAAADPYLCLNAWLDELPPEARNDWKMAIFAADPATLVHPAVSGTPVGTQEPKRPKTFADILEQSNGTQFDWDPWLARGYVTGLAAQSGTGKSYLAMRIVKSYTAREAWPDGSPYIGEAGKVLWCECECSQKLNADRALAIGLNPEHILVPLDDELDDVNLNNPDHKKAIETLARRPDVKLIVIDSLSGGQPGARENEALGADAIRWLARLAKAVDKPILVIHHLRKQSQLAEPKAPTIEDLRGHGTIGQVPRVVWGLWTPDSDKKDQKQLLVIKSNVGQFPEPLTISIDDEGLHFGPCVQGSAQPPTRVPKRRRARQLLLSLLADGPVKYDAIETAADEAGISMDTVERAAEVLGVSKDRDGHTKRWSWKLPSEEESTADQR